MAGTSSTLDHQHPVDPDAVAHARARVPGPDETSRLAGLLSVMADPVRLRIVFALDETEELCVGDLALALDISEDSAGYALKLLRAAGLVVTRKDGRIVYNRLADDFPEPLRDYCLRQLIELSGRGGAGDDDTSDGDDGADGGAVAQRHVHRHPAAV